MKSLPSDNKAADEGSSNGAQQVVVHGDVHYSPNDIAELRKLADDHPELASQIVADRRETVRLDQRTERLGMLLSVILGVVLIAGTTFAIVQLGWWQSIMFVASLLGISHILRTVLKGEFSDTSWFGRIMTNTPKSDPEDKG